MASLFLDENKGWIRRTSGLPTGSVPYTFTTPANCRYIQVQFIRSVVNMDSIIIEQGETTTAYQPFGTTAVIQFGQTLYGAKIDWKGRRAVATHVGVDMGTLTWNYATTYKYFTAFIEDIKVYAANQKPDIISEQYKTVVSRSAVYWETADDMSIGTRATYSNVVVKDSRYTDKNTFTTAVNGVWMVYPLATPVEIPLSLVDFVTVPGINNVFADCGDVDLTYWTNV